MAAYKAEVEFRHRTFIPDDATKQHIEEVARWITSNDSKFGIFICGICGNGKTTMVLAIRSIINFLYEKDTANAKAICLVTATELCEMAKNNYEKYCNIMKCEMLAIDDMGKDAVEILHYGNVSRPLIDLLSYRYDKQLFTIVTTNMPPNDIAKYYDERIADRFREMMHSIAFENESYRI